MKDVIFENIKFKNFRNFTDMEYSFPIDKFHLICGVNGSGKSTIFKAVSMALYGDDGSAKGDRASIQESVNAKHNKNLEIILRFRIVDEDETFDNYRVEAYAEHEKYRDSLYLYKNDVDISGETKTQTKKNIESILYPRDVYHTVVLFNQQVKDFFTALTNSQQQDIFNAILDLSEYDVSYNRCDISLKKIRQDINDTRSLIYEIEKKLSSNESVYQKLISLEQEFIKNKAESLNSIESKLEEKKEILDDLKKKKENYPDIYSQIQSLNSRKNTLQKSDNELSYQLNELESKYIEKLKNEIDSLKNELQRSYHLFKDVQHSKLDHDKEELNIEIQSIQNEINQLNVVFSTNDTEIEINNHESRKNEILTELTNSMNLEISTYLDNSHKISKDLQNQLSILHTKKSENNKDIEDEISEIELKITEFSSKQQELKSKFETQKQTVNSTTSSNMHQISNYRYDIDKSMKEVELDSLSLQSGNSICSKCKQELNSEHKLEVQKSIDSNKILINDLQNKVSLLENNNIENNQYISDLKNKIDKSSSELDAIINQFKLDKKILSDKMLKLSETCTNEINLIMRQLNESNEKFESFKKDVSIKYEISKKEKINLIDVTIETLKSKNIDVQNKRNQRKIDLESQIDILKKKKTSLDEELTRILNNKQLELKSNYNSKSLTVNNRIENEKKITSDDLKNKRSIIIKQIEEIDSELNDLNVIDTEIRNLEFTIQTVEFAISSLESDLLNQTNKEFSREEMDSLKSKIDLLYQEKAVLDDKISKFLKEEEILGFWKIGFSDKGIKSMLIDSAIPFINREWNRILNEIAPGMFTVSMDTLSETKAGDIREKLSINILHNLKGTNQFKLLSGGEKRMIDLSMMRVLKELAANLYQKRIRMNLLDEILDSLDQENALSFCRILKQFSEYEHISLITHNMGHLIESDEKYVL